MSALEFLVQFAGDIAIGMVPGKKRGKSGKYDLASIPNSKTKKSHISQMRSHPRTSRKK